MIEGVVYRYVSPDGKSYVGQTTNETRRRKEFATIANNPDGNSQSYRVGAFREAIKKYGGDSFIYEVLYRNKYATKKEAQADLWQKEEFFIRYFNSYNDGYNQTLGGLAPKGFKPSKEQVENQRKWLKEFYKTHPNPFKGKKHSEKAKRLLSKLASMRTGEKSPMYGKHLSEKQKKAISERMKLNLGEKNHFFGKTHKESTKELISEANGLPVLMIDPQTDEVLREFGSARKAGEYLGNPRLNSEIIKCCRGYVSPSGRHYLTCKGYKWKYQER